MKHLPFLTAASLVASLCLPALAQTRSQRVDQLANILSNSINDNANDSTAVYTDAQTGETIAATPAQLMRQTMTSVDFKDIPGKLALEIWSNQTNIPLVISWKSLEAQGIDPNAPINLTLGRVPAEQVLKLIIQQLHPEPLGNDRLLLDIQQWFVRVITKEDALRRSTTKLYFIGDLLMDIPHFDNAPRMDLDSALSNTSSGGSNGNGGNQGNNNFFTDDQNDQKEERLSKQEKAERIADMIRNTIEPDIWRANGGEYGSVRYYRGMLVVKAPDFVHEQIGGLTGASITNKASTKRQATTRRTSDTQPAPQQGQRSSSGNVAGVGPDQPTLVR